MRPVVLKEIPHLSFLYRHKTRDITKNFVVTEGLALIQTLLGTDFKAAHFAALDSETQLSVSKKGKVLSVAVSDTPTFKNVTTTGDLNVGGTVHAHGGLDVHNNRIVNVADPKDPTDAVNKRYVDNAVKNINVAPIK